MAIAKLDIGKSLALFSDYIKKNGPTAKGVGWNDDVSHRIRLEKLLYVVNADESEISVNDLGCGYGALYSQIKARSATKLKRFYGYDINPDMLETARRLIQTSDAEFIQSDHCLHMADYSFQSGMFNTKFDQQDADWEIWVKEVLNDLNQHSTKGFAFNSLSTYVDYKVDHLYYADPLQFFEYCKRQFSPHVALLHDYPLYEWTMIVRKPA